MAVYGYIFLPVTGEQEIPLGDQHCVITSYAASLGLELEGVVIEQQAPATKPFRERPEGGKLLHGLRPGDTVVAMKAAWVLTSAKEGAKLMRSLNKRAISLYCVDLEENISMPAERRLMVSEGNAALVQKLLDALAACENRGYGDAIRANKRARKLEGKYIGGPVSFGWQVSKDGFLEQNFEQQKVIEKIRKLRADRRSYRYISLELKNKLDIKLSHEGIRRILENDRRKKVAERARRITLADPDS